MTNAPDAVTRLEIALEKERERVRGADTELARVLEELRRVQLQLIEAEKLESIGRLAAGVAHEIKNPLAIIAMGVEFLQGRHGSDDVTAGVLKELADAVTRADNVSRGLLDFSAPHRLEIRLHDLNQIARTAVGLVRGEIHRGRHHVEFELGEIPPVPIDPGKTIQVFVNLLTNALHAMSDGGGAMIVRTRVGPVDGPDASSGDPEWAVIAEVADTGPGIPEGLLGRIFEPFFTTMPTGKGTGLGMGVVKSIMTLQHGRVEMRNREGGGAMAVLTFRIQPVS